MSKLTDYSKWDNLDSDDECEVTATNASVLNTAKSKGPTLDELRKGEKFGAAEQEEELRNNPAPHLENQADIAAAMGAGGPGGGVGRGSSIPNPGAKSKIKMTEKGSEKGRYVFSHQGQKIYEWEQSLEEVNLYITPPQGVLASYFDIDIGVKKLVVALKGSDQKFIEEETFGVVDVGERCVFCFFAFMITFGVVRFAYCYCINIHCISLSPLSFSLSLSQHMDV